MPTLAGTKLDKYDMLEEVGHGGMAVVYRGRDSVLEREVAVKVLHAHLANREESRRRLQREALAVAKLRHENILEIFDYSGPQAEESYIVTEFIHGPTLREWLDQKHDPRPAIAAMIVHRLCLALCCAHKSGIVHRDIKPENVMIRTEDGCVKLMDFGIAQILDNQKLTMTGQLIGSPAYMAPELINGRPLDARTDLFSLGIMLYQLSTGALPFSGRNPHEVLNRIADGEYPAPSTICPLVDKDLEAIIAKALASNPDDRYQSVETFAAELESYLEEVGIEPSPAELARYFNEPEDYIRDLDARVSQALMDRATLAAREGHGARAIRLVGRVLELDPEHKEARALLGRLRVRERRTRQLLVGAAAVAVGGLVAAGFVLVPEGVVRHERLAAQQAVLGAAEDEQGSAQGAADPVGEAILPRDLVVPADTSAEARRPAVGDDDAPPGDEADGARLAQDEAGSPEATPTPVRGKGRVPPRTEVKTRCTIRFKGVGASTAKDLKVKVGQSTHRLSGTTLDVEFDGTQALLVLDDDDWKARKMLDRTVCPGPVEVPVSMPPARIVFSGFPNKCAVECSGCGRAEDNHEVDGTRYMLEDFPALRVNDALGTRARFEFSCPGFAKASVRKNIMPGKNTVSASLEPLGSE